VSWAPVGQPGDLFADPHLLATGGLVDVFVSRFGEEGGKVAGLPALPVEFGPDRQRPGLRRQPPRLGEHSAEVLGEAGFTAAEIAALAESGTIAGHFAATSTGATRYRSGKSRFSASTLGRS